MSGLRVLVPALLLAVAAVGCADDESAEMAVPEWQMVTYDRVVLSVPASWSNMSDIQFADVADELTGAGFQEDYVEFYADPENQFPYLAYGHPVLGTNVVVGWAPLLAGEDLDQMARVGPAIYAEMMPGVEVATDRTEVDGIEALRVTVLGGPLAEADLVMHEYMVDPGSGECLFINITGKQGRDEAIFEQIMASVDIELDSETG